MNNYIVTLRFNAHYSEMGDEPWECDDFPYEGEATASVSAETEERAKELALGYHFEDQMRGILDGDPVVDKVVFEKKENDDDEYPEEVWDFAIEEPELEELY